MSLAKGKCFKAHLNVKTYTCFSAQTIKVANANSGKQMKASWKPNVKRKENRNRMAAFYIKYFITFCTSYYLCVSLCAFRSFWFTLIFQERRRLSLRFPQKLFLPEDEEEVRKLIGSCHAMPSPEQESSNENTSRSTNINGMSILGSPTLTQHTTFINTAQRRSPHMARRKRTTPSASVRENKTL